MILQGKNDWTFKLFLLNNYTRLHIATNYTRCTYGHLNVYDDLLYDSQTAAKVVLTSQLLLYNARIPARRV